MTYDQLMTKRMLDRMYARHNPQLEEKLAGRCNCGDCEQCVPVSVPRRRHTKPPFGLCRLIDVRPGATRDKAFHFVGETATGQFRFVIGSSNLGMSKVSHSSRYMTEERAVTAWGSK